MTEVNWYTDEVVLLFENITEEAALQAAFQVEAEYKINARVDTGFMRNSTYVHSAKTSTFQPSAQTIQGVMHETTGSPPPVEENTVYVGVGANYAIYNEMQDSALYGALQRVAAQFGAMIRAAAASKL